MSKLLTATVHVAGAVAVTLPLIAGDSGAPEAGGNAPWVMVLLTPLLLFLTLAEMTRGRLDSKKVALLGLLAGVAAVLRLPISLAGGNLIFLLPILAGGVFGPTFGFLLGAFAMIGSALLTGGIGPWVPVQALACGWVGAGAGIVGGLLHKKGLGAKVAGLCAYGVVAAMFYGAVLDLYFWPILAAGNTQISWMPGLGLAETLRRFARFYLLTSMAWDLIGSVTNAVGVAVIGVATIKVFERFKARFEWVSNPGDLGLGDDDLAHHPWEVPEEVVDTDRRLVV